jgi:hypothetical protein
MNEEIEEEELKIFKGGEWLLEYNKEQMIGALMNLAYPDRRKGGNKTWTEEYTVTRTSWKKNGGKEPYQETKSQHFTQPMLGTDMGKYRLTINQREYHWSELKKMSPGLLRWLSFNTELTKEHFYTPKLRWEK